MNLRNHDLFLGYNWLQKHNLSIDWKDSSISLHNCQQQYRKIYIPKEPKEDIIEEKIKENTIEKGEKILFVNLEEEAQRREEFNIRSKSKSIEEMEGDIPEEYKNFNNQVFNKAMFKKLPNQFKQNHIFELIPNITLKNCKVYLLNIKEQEELNKFLKEYLKSGRIKPFKSCVASFFFIKKKGWFTTTSTRLLIT